MADRQTISRSGDITLRKSQINILSMAEGFFHSSVLLALLRLGIFDLIGEGSKTLNALASELGSQAQTLARLLNAGVVLKLLESDDGTNFRLSSISRSVLLPSVGDNYLGDWIRNMGFVSLALSNLDKAVLKSGPNVDPLACLGADKASTRELALAMHNYASLHAKELVHFLDTNECDTLLDVGCGPGTYSFYLGMCNPRLRLFLLDLPEVLEVTKEIHQKYPVKNEIRYLPLNALKDDIPGSYDLVFVSNMLHMLGEPDSRRLICRLYNAINKGGFWLYRPSICRMIAWAAEAAVFLDLLQLCITSEGRNHSVTETRQWLEAAGLTNVQVSPMALVNPNSFVRGYRV